MKILVFNGSPKKDKSDTMHITRAFLNGMEEAATQEIHTIDVTDKHIEFCRGCFACKYNGGHCVIDDDMREILEQMLSSDLLLFSYHSISGLTIKCSSFLLQFLKLSCILYILNATHLQFLELKGAPQHEKQTT